MKASVGTELTMPHIRLNKAIAASGLCSRRKADGLIAGGQVRVNNVVVQKLGTKIDPEKDRVTVGGKRLEGIGPGDRKHLYLVLNKPPGVVSTTRDPQGRRIVLDLLPESATRERVLPVGRLDYSSEGLLLLTNDGALINTLTHPSSHVAKTYRVLVRGRVTREVLKTMQQGMTLLEGERLAPVTVTVKSRERENVWLEMILLQGVNRQIRRMCRDLGLKVVRLIRTRQGPISLKGMRSGAFRHLTAFEIEELKNLY